MPQLEHSFELQMTYLGPILEHVGIVYTGLHRQYKTLPVIAKAKQWPT